MYFTSRVVACTLWNVSGRRGYQGVPGCTVKGLVGGLPRESWLSPPSGTNSTFWAILSIDRDLFGRIIDGKYGHFGLLY